MYPHHPISYRHTRTHTNNPLPGRPRPSVPLSEGDLGLLRVVEYRGSGRQRLHIGMHGDVVDVTSMRVMRLFQAVIFRNSNVIWKRLEHLLLIFAVELVLLRMVTKSYEMQDGIQ